MILPNVLLPHDVILRPGFICLIDSDTGRTITNDAENIVTYLIALGHDLSKNRVLYRDTMGYWDELEVKNNRFFGFRLIRATDLDAAIAEAQGRRA